MRKHKGTPYTKTIYKNDMQYIFMCENDMTISDGWDCIWPCSLGILIISDDGGKRYWQGEAE